MSFTAGPKRDIDANGIEYHRHQWGATPEAYVCGYVNQDGTPCGAWTAGWSWPSGMGMHYNASQAGQEART